MGAEKTRATAKKRRPKRPPFCGNASAQLNPPKSQINRMIGSGMPISQSNSPRPI
jgi:hypothetical protein